MTNKPTIQPSDVALLETILSTGEWMLARQIAVNWRWLEVYPHEDGRSRQAWLEAQERRIRATANASKGSTVSFPGSAGYRLRSACTDDEIQTAIAKLKHQSAEMLARATAIEQYGRNKEQLQLV